LVRYFVSSRTSPAIEDSRRERRQLDDLVVLRLN